jgi:hypothetical protein
MRSATFCCCCIAILSGCSNGDKRTADHAGSETGMSDSSAITHSPTVSLQDFAGRWNTRSTDERGNVIGEAVLSATADSSGWTLTFPKQKPIPMRVIAVGGDSVITEAGPYSSSRLKGAQIRTRAVNRIQDGKLVASLEAHYTLAGRDSVLHLRVEGTRQE